MLLERLIYITIFRECRKSNGSFMYALGYNTFLMKPLYMQAAEERLKGQPPRHAKVYKDDISVFEADMMYVRNYLMSSSEHSFGSIEKATGIPKATVRKLLSSYGIKRIYTKEKLLRMKERNRSRYTRIITGRSRVLKDENGRWKALEYRESDRERFKAWLMERSNMLVTLKTEKRNMYLIVDYPEDVKEEIAAEYPYRSWVPIEL